jgi:uncharacterized membrane protein (DUF4010 family)
VRCCWATGDYITPRYWAAWSTAPRLSTKLAQEGALVSLAVPIMLLTVIAIFIRNLIILAIFAPSAAPLALWPMLAMAAGAAYFAWSRRDKTIRPSAELKLSSPVSLRKVLRFGLLFLAIEAVGTLGLRFLGADVLSGDAAEGRNANVSGNLLESAVMRKPLNLTV